MHSRMTRTAAQSLCCRASFSAGVAVKRETVDLAVSMDGLLVYRPRGEQPTGPTKAIAIW